MKVPGHYILIGQTPVPEPDLLKYAEWMETADTIVARTEIAASVVSTVFLGLDHNWGLGPPKLFETMIFTDGEPEDYQGRCSTWLEAEAIHQRAVESVRDRNARKQRDRTGIEGQ